MQRWQRIAGVVLLVVAGVAVEQALFVLPVTEFGQPGPGFMPLGLGILLGVFAVALIVGNRGADSRRVAFWEAGGWSRPLVAILLFVALALALPWTGFVVGLAAFVAVWLLIEERRPLWAALLTGVLTGAAIYLVFSVALQVPLPKGVLFGS